MRSRARVLVFPDLDALAAAAAERVGELLVAAVAERGSASVALSGGGTPKPFHRRLAAREEGRREGAAARIDWRHVDVLWGDERAVPPDHEESNYRMAFETLLVPLGEAGPPPGRVHRIEGERPAEEAAALYAEELRRVLGPELVLDVAVQGLGADGHTASLFPATEDLGSLERPVLATESPEPPHARVSLALPVLNRARHVVFLVSSEAKAEAVAEVLAARRTGATGATGAAGVGSVPPGARVDPVEGELVFFLDRAAASKLDPADLSPQAPEGGAR